MKKGQNNLKLEASQWADEVYNSIDGMGRAEANPYLFTRIMARLEAGNNGWERVAGFISRPVFAMASIALFIAVNIGVIYVGEKGRQESLAARKAVAEQMLASEFSNSQTTYVLVESNEEK